MNTYAHIILQIVINNVARLNSFFYFFLRPIFLFYI